MRGKQRKRLNFFLISIVFAILISPLILAEVTHWSADSQADFVVSGGGAICTNNGYTWVESDGVTETDSTTDCYREGGYNDQGGASDNCCPSGQTCNQGTGECEEPEIIVSRCSEYLTQKECKGAPLEVGVNSMEEIKGEGFCDWSDCEIGGVTGYVEINCFCMWDEDANNGDGECVGSWNRDDNCDPSNNGQCVLGNTQTQDECGTGADIFTISWTATWYQPDIESDPDGGIIDGDPECQSGSEEFLCPITAKLIFSTIGTILGIVLIIIIIYYILDKRKTKKRVKK